MFEMTTDQQNAFKSAANNMPSWVMDHFVLIVIAALATIWLFMAFIGLFRRQDVSVYESIYDFAWAVALYILTGVICYIS